MSHSDHNHYFFKKDLTAEQIKAAQDHLKTHHDAEPETSCKNGGSLSQEMLAMKKNCYISKTYGVPLEAIKFQTASLSLGIQTKPTIRLISIPTLFVGTCSFAAANWKSELIS